MCVLSIKMPIRKNSGNLFNDPRTIANIGPSSVPLSILIMLRSSR